jgi:hypothetical protein
MPDLKPIDLPAVQARIAAAMRGFERYCHDEPDNTLITADLPHAVEILRELRELALAAEMAYRADEYGVGALVADEVLRHTVLRLTGGES